MSEGWDPGLAEGAELADGFRVARLHGRHVLLRLVSPEDYRFLRSAELGGELAVRWRYRGATVSPDQWAHNLWQSVLAQFLVVGVSDPAPLGLVVVYKANFQDGHAYLAVERFGSRRKDPLLFFGVALFLDYVFGCWNFEKLYLEVAEYNLVQFRSGVGRFFDVEARLRGHLWYDGRRWDQVTLALYRERWQERAGKILAAVRAPAEQRLIMRLPPTPEVAGGG
jgi:hypothetical protein